MFMMCAAAWSHVDDCGLLPPEVMLMSMDWASTGDYIGVMVHVALEAMLMSLTCAAAEDYDSICGP